MKKILLLMVFAVAMTVVNATNYYWVGGVGSSGSPKDWNTGSNWSTSSGGAGGVVVPGSGDVAIFDASTNNVSPFVSVDTYTIALAGLQVLPASGATTHNVLSLIGTAATFSLSGDLTINAVKPSTTQYNGQIVDYGNNTITVSGNVATNAASSCTLVTASNTNSNANPGRIALIGATPTIGSGATGGNLGFLNFDISSTTNATFNSSANAFTILGNLNIQTGGKLTITKTLQFTSTAPSGSNPFILKGTISGTGVIVGNTGWTFLSQGTLPSSYNTSNLQSIGTVYLDPTSATTSSVNGIQQKRPYSTVTFAPAYLSSTVPTIAVGGSITIDGGVLDDGGNTINVAGGNTLVTTNTTAGLAVHTGTGRVRAIRTSANPSLVTAGKTLTVGNLEIGSASSAVTYAVGSGTNLTINGTLTLSKAGSVINASGSNITFQNANVPIALTAGTITTDANTTLNFGSTGNTGGSAFIIPNGLFTSAPTIGTLNITRDNKLTLNNQALTATTINVNPGSKLSLGATLTTTNLNIKSNATSGTATLVDNGYGITATNTSVEQYLSSPRNWYMSSPVTGATASAGPTYYKYVEALNNGTTWTTVNSGDGFDVMTGYIVKPTAASTYTFSGTLNTGNKTVNGLTSTASAKTGFNLVGNPYPSYVKWSEVVKTNVGETMWYRTHNGSSYKFYTYHPVDGAGGIGVPATVTDYIPPMQAFWVKVDAGQTGSLQFLNSGRDHKDAAGSIFRAPKATSSSRKMLRLQVSDASESDETVIYFNENASDNADSYDAPKMFNNNAAIPEIYTTAGDEKLVINGLNAVKYDTEIPLGFVTGESNTFSIKALAMNNFGEDTQVVLRDKVQGVDYELTGDNAYTFTSDATNATSRFSVLFKTPSVTTDMNENGFNTMYAFVNANNKIEIIAAENTAYSIYNALGVLIQKGVVPAKTEISDSKLTHGVYVVILQQNNGIEKTSKLIIR